MTAKCPFCEKALPDSPIKCVKGSRYVKCPGCKRMVELEKPKPLLQRVEYGIPPKWR